MWDSRIFSDLMKGHGALAIGAVAGVLAIIALRALFWAVWGAASEIYRVGLREYLRRWLDMDSERVRLIGVLIWVVIAVLLLAFPWGFTLYGSAPARAARPRTRGSSSTRSLGPG